MGPCDRKTVRKDQHTSVRLQTVRTLNNNILGTLLYHTSGHQKQSSCRNSKHERTYPQKRLLLGVFEISRELVRLTLGVAVEAEPRGAERRDAAADGEQEAPAAAGERLLTALIDHLERRCLVRLNRVGKEERGENKAKERRTIRDDWDRRAVCCAWLLWDAVEKSGRKVCKLSWAVQTVQTRRGKGESISFTKVHAFYEMIHSRVIRTQS